MPRRNLRMLKVRCLPAMLIAAIAASLPAAQSDSHRTHFNFRKLGRLIESPSGMPKPGPYYTTLVDMKDVPGFPHDYALYFSTDHARGKGGIWLYVSSGSPTDPAHWKSYDQAAADGDFDHITDRPAANPIFADTTQGRQTETPHANVIDGVVFMTYHNAGAGHGQSTLLATSKDGVNFKRINGKRDSVILDYDPKKEVGDGHTGYFRWRPNPFPRLAWRFVGYSLHGGGNDFHGAMWGSNDAIKWTKLKIFDSPEGYAVEGDRIIRRRAMVPGSITPLGNGEYLALCAVGNRSSGGRPRVLEFYEVYLADDGMTLTRESRKVLKNGPPGSYDEEELGGGTAVLIGGTWHLIYVGTSGRASRNTIMAATGTLDLSAPKSARLPPASDAPDLEALLRRGDVYEECGRSVRGLLQGWLDFKYDEKSGLIASGTRWNYHNEAADHYSSLVLMARCLRPELNAPGGRLHSVLTSMKTRCILPNGIPADYDMKAQKRIGEADFGHLAEWLRDGLIRIAEVTGTDNDWYREMERLLDAMLAEAEKRGGMAKTFPGPENAGNMLQTLARLYALSGKERYIRAAEELADAYLLKKAGGIGTIRFIDHGCELVPGLCELFAVESQAGRAGADAYRAPLARLLDGILETGAHPETGLLCGFRTDEDGERRWRRPPDTWGYVLFGYENYDHATGEGRYTEAVTRPLTWLLKNRTRYLFLRRTLWPASHSRDRWSDSYESFMVLWKRHPEVGDGYAWLDWASRMEAHRRYADQDYGPYHGDHFDGSTGRALCAHMMLNSRGVCAVPFRKGLRLGGIERDGALRLALKSDRPWRGRLCFDGPRGRGRGATLNWARINELPAWFVVEPGMQYRICFNGRAQVVKPGAALICGIDIEAGAGLVMTIDVIHIR